MGVFTTLTHPEIADLLSPYGLTLINAKGVSEGTVNTYYRLNTDRGTYYLRIDERADSQAVEREIALLHYLDHLAVPHPIPTEDHRFHGFYKNKPVILFSPIPGSPIASEKLTGHELKQIGEWLSELHRVTITSEFFTHRFHPDFLFNTLYRQIEREVETRYPDAASAISRACSSGWEAYTFNDLPQAIIHADLFEENLHFEKGSLVGVIDFEAAGRGPRLLDLAIAIQALCFDVASSRFHPEKADTLIRAYLKRTRLTKAERAAWPQILSYSALRFLITRLQDFELSPNKDRQGSFKDYREYLAHLKALPELVGLI